MSDPVCSLIPQPEVLACYADPLDQPVCSQPQDPSLSQPFCSDAAQKCYAKKSDFIADYQANQASLRSRAFGLTAKMFAPQAPAVAQAKPKKEEGFIEGMWGDVGDMWSYSWNDSPWYEKPFTFLGSGLATVGAGGLTVVAGVLSVGGCSPADDTHESPEIPDASPPPPTTDSVCDDRVRLIQGLSSKDTSLDTLVNGLTFSALDYTVGGTPFQTDSAGNYITTITPKKEDIVGYQKAGDKLFVLFNPKTTGDAVAPGLILVYKIDGSTLTPVTTNEILNNGTSNAINLPFFRPTNFAKVSDSEIDIMWDALTNRGPAEIDPATGNPIPQLPLISMFNPATLSLWNTDWCSNKSDAGADAGSGFGDGGGGMGGDSGVGDAGAGGG